MKNGYDILLERLNIFIREYYKNELVRGIIYSFIGLASMLIIFSLIEHFGFFSRFTRSFLFWIYCGLGILIIAKFMIIPIIKLIRLTKRLSNKEAAKIIGLHFDDIADKLTNILELKNSSSGNITLIEASINQKIKTIKPFQFNKAIKWKQTMYYARFIMIPAFIILLFFISGNKNIISDSTFRIINYNQDFIKPAPFYFSIENDSLTVIEKENFTLKVDVNGEKLPAEVYINYDNKTRKMKSFSKSQHTYTFKNIQKNTDFFLSANNEYSKKYRISILNRAIIEGLTLFVSPPEHTGFKKQKIKNSGAVKIPEGSFIRWEIKTTNTDSLRFLIKNKAYGISPYEPNKFKFQKTINETVQYAIAAANDNVLFADTLFYDIQLINDAHPVISITQKPSDSTLFISGTIRDDYGFFDLQFISEISGQKTDTVIKESILIEPSIKYQSFLQPLKSIKEFAQAGDEINSYFIVRDNDRPNGYKSTQSERITINIPTYKEIKYNYEKNNELIKTELEAEVSLLQDLKKEFTEFEKSLIEKDSLDWRDRKKLEELLKKQSQIDNTIQELKNNTTNNFDKLNSTSETSENIKKKQKALEKLFNEIMPEEMKELYDELNQLKEELNKSDLQKKLEELKFSNEDLEKELDRSLEVLKQVEFEQKLEELINQLNILANKQMQLSKEKEDALQTHTEQEEEFKNIQKEIEKLKQLNNNLENKHNIIDTSEKETEIKNTLNEASKQLKNNNKQKANKAQKKAGEDLQQLANLFTNMKQNNEQEQNYEDMNVLRQILENLVYFSMEEESLLLEFQQLDKDDPKYVKLMHRQQDLRDAANIIEDSLFALSKRVPQISSKINREINTIDKKTQSSIDYFRERLTQKAVQDQQFIMTSANNLAVLLSSILESMQQDMASDLPSNQQCEKPGKGSPKPGDLKKMQDELNKHLQKMKEELEKGEQNDMQKGGMSKKLVEMLAKQEMIRESLKDLRQEMDDKKGMQALEEAIKKMEQTEKDIANKKLTLESLKRQKEISTKLLEIENALRQQDEDNERESKTAKSNYERVLQEVYDNYEKNKLQQTEMIKTTPPALNNYYKEKVDRYFNLFLEK